MRMPQGWEWLIIAALILLLFGAKRLPDAARGLGRSLRIFKAETKGLTDDADKPESLPPAREPSSGEPVQPAKPQELPAPERTEG